jgi:VCBS repeat-containing protein
MKNFRLLFLLLVLVTAFVSCKKDKDPAPPTKTDLLTAKTWKISTSTVNPAVDYGVVNQAGDTVVFTVTDILDFYTKVGATCNNDNTIKFNKTPNSYTREDGATRCSPNVSVLETGTWTFNSDETVLALSVPGYAPDNYTITTLDATSLVLTQTITSQSGRVYTFVETYTAQ